MRGHYGFFFSLSFNRFLEKLSSPDWKPFQTEESSEGAIVLESQDFSDAPTTAFLCTYTLSGQSDFNKIVLLLHDFSLRLKWDKGSLSPDSHKLKQITPTRSIDVSVSEPALGGVISSRVCAASQCFVEILTFLFLKEFLDLREFEVTENGFVYFAGSVESSFKYSPAKSRVLGRNFPCGIVAKKDGNDMKIQMLWHAEVRGWLPASVVSKAMPGRFLMWLPRP